MAGHELLPVKRQLIRFTALYYNPVVVVSSTPFPFRGEQPTPPIPASLLSEA